MTAARHRGGHVSTSVAFSGVNSAGRARARIRASGNGTSTTRPRSEVIRAPHLIVNVPSTPSGGTQEIVRQWRRYV